MLYERWLRIARHGHNRVALIELATGRRWTFDELAAEGKTGGDDSSPVAFPQGMTAEFILTVLRAWRLNQVVCPLEVGQSVPVIEPLPGRGIVHLKATSGTTGLSRMAAFTSTQLAADADHIVETMQLSSEWPNLAVISLAHSYGFSNLVLPLLLHGIPLVLVEAPLPEALRKAATTASWVTLPAVPALWRAWHEGGAIPSNIRVAISAGAPLPLALEGSVFESTGLKIHNFYGSSECGGIAYDSSKEPREDASCVGSPLRNVGVSIAADGCVEVRSDAVAEGYWPERMPVLGAGVFHTSDLGEISCGLVFLRGRASEQINVAGRKVVPEVVERALAAHPGVRDCLVFGVPGLDPQRGETIVACVSLRSNLRPDDLKQYALGVLSAWQIPREWWIVESLESNGRGKFSRAEWRRRYIEENGSPGVRDHQG